MDSPCWESFLGHLHLLHMQHEVSTIGVSVPIWQNGTEPG